MTRLLVKVSEKNKGFILYNHLFVKKDPWTLEEIRKELKDDYGLEVDMNFLRHEIREYLDSGLVMHDLSGYITTMQ